MKSKLHKIFIFISVIFICNTYLFAATVIIKEEVQLTGKISITSGFRERHYYISLEKPFIFELNDILKTINEIKISNFSFDLIGNFSVNRIYDVFGNIIIDDTRINQPEIAIYATKIRLSDLNPTFFQRLIGVSNDVTVNNNFLMIVIIFIVFLVLYILKRNKIIFQDKICQNIVPLNIKGISGNIYSGFWSRLGANLLDFLIFLPFLLLLMFINRIHLYVYFITLIPNLLFIFWYHIYLPKRYGGTPGKLIVGIKIVKMNSSPIGWKESILRHCVYFIFSIISIGMTAMAILLADIEIYESLTRIEKSAYLSSLSPGQNVITILTHIWVWSEVIVLLFNKRKRAIHDFIAGTVIIKSKYIKEVQEQMEKSANTGIQE